MFFLFYSTEDHVRLFKWFSIEVETMGNLRRAYWQAWFDYMKLLPQVMLPTSSKMIAAQNEGIAKLIELSTQPLLKTLPKFSSNKLPERLYLN